MQQAVLVYSNQYRVENKTQEKEADLDYCFRELAFVVLAYRQEWATHLKELLLAIQGQADWHHDRKLVLSDIRKRAYDRCYDEIIMQGIWHPDNRLMWTRWVKEGKAANLLPTASTPSTKMTALEFYTKENRVKRLLDYLRMNKSRILLLMSNAV
jgi:hypothetical protein